MRKTWVIFKKEIMDTLRDRRTIIMMIVIPLVVFPLIMNLMVRITTSQTKKAQEKVLKVGLISHGNAAEFRAKLFARPDMLVDENLNEADISDLIQRNRKDFVLVFAEDFDQKITEGKTGEVRLYFKASSENEIARRRLSKMLNDFEEAVVALRLHELNLEKSFLHALEIKEHDLASTKEKIGEYIGGFIPYIFVIFCFLGAMYPAIDLAAGEKERATIETLLASPASRMQIVIGKFLVVTLAGIISAVIAILGLFLSVKQITRIPQHILDEIIRIIEWKSVALLLSLLIPLCVFFAAVLLSISIFARTFKEAQSAMAPMNFVVIVPAAIGIIPGIKLNTTTALIPILNVSLATRQIIAGTIKIGLLLEVYLSLFILAGLSLYFCTHWFKRESVIFRAS